MLQIKFSCVFIALSFSIATVVIGEWSVFELAEMPEPVSNNAVVAAELNGNWFVYSFGGIDSSKIWSGISNRSFRYDVANDLWDTIAPLPASNTWIAAAASCVKGKIYIIGGYHVFQNGNEVSNQEVYVFNPFTNSYETNGQNIPLPIDDQVQAVWRDSLIYVITGWSNTTNVPNVQIYNPANDSWMAGTPVPNTIDYKVFGGSGVIIGDTIFYTGGARTGGNFPLTNIFRTGIIQPDQPDSIYWFSKSDPLALAYRMAAFEFNRKPHWLGGSDVSYNFNGVAYNGSGGVEPLNRIVYYDFQNDTLVNDSGAINPVMDLRGIGQIAHNEWIVCGGMLPGQQVSDKAYLIRYGELTTSNLTTKNSFEWKIFSKPENSFMISLTEFEPGFSVRIFNSIGQAVLQTKLTNRVVEFSLNREETGVYFVVLRDGNSQDVAGMGKRVFVW